MLLCARPRSLATNRQLRRPGQKGRKEARRGDRACIVRLALGCWLLAAGCERGKRAPSTRAHQGGGQQWRPRAAARLANAVAVAWQELEVALRAPFRALTYASQPASPLEATYLTLRVDAQLADLVRSIEEPRKQERQAER